MQNLLNPLYSEHLAAVPHYKAHSRLASRSADPEAILNHSAIKCYVENANAFITGNDTAISNTTGVCNPVTERRYLSKIIIPLMAVCILWTAACKDDHHCPPCHTPLKLEGTK